MRVPSETGRPSPLRRILVATDLSAAAIPAAERAAQLPLAPGARITLLHAIAAEGKAAQRRAVRTHARRVLDRVAQRIEGLAARAGHQGVTVQRTLVEGEPFVEIIRRARQDEAELILVGRHGRRSIRRMFFGTTTARVTSMASLPVLVVRQHPRGPYRRLVVAIDLSDASRAVLRLSLRLLPAEVQSATLVHAYRSPFEGFVQDERYEQDAALEAETACAQLIERAPFRGLQWQLVVRHGDARMVIVRELRRRRADLVALGTHGRSGMRRILLGSVAEWVAIEAPCDVLLSRPRRFTFELP